MGSPNYADNTPAKSLLKDRNLICLLFITAIGVMGVSSMTPILPGLARRFEVSDHVISLVLISYTLPGVICTPLSGILADRVGRLQVLVPSLLIFGICGTLGAIGDSFTWFLAMRFAQGIGSAALGLLNMTIISDLYDDPIRRTKALAYVSAALSVSTAGTPVIAGFLGSISVELVMLLPALAIPLALYIWRYVPLKSVPSTNQPIGKYLLKTIKSAGQHDILTVILLTFITFSLLFGTMATFLPILLDVRFQASSATIGLMFSMASLGTLTGTLWISQNLRKLSPYYLLLAGYSMFLLAAMTIPWIPFMVLLLIPIFFWGLGQGLNAPILNTIMLNYAPPENRGGLLAIQGTTIRIAQTIGPSIFSIIYVTLSLNWVYAAASCLALTMILLVVFRIPKGKI